MKEKYFKTALTFMYVFCFNREQLIQPDYSFASRVNSWRGAEQSKQWKNSVHQGNNGKHVAMCTLFKTWTYNLKHHNHLQHSSLENMASTIIKNAHMQVYAITIAIHQNFPSLG